MPIRLPRVGRLRLTSSWHRKRKKRKSKKGRKKEKKRKRKSHPLGSLRWVEKEGGAFGVGMTGDYIREGCVIGCLKKNGFFATRWPCGRVGGWCHPVIFSATSWRRSVLTGTRLQGCSAATSYRVSRKLSSALRGCQTHSRVYIT